MKLWHQSGNTYTAFALKVNEEVRIIDFVTLISLKYAGVKQLNTEKIMELSQSFEEWEDAY